MSFLRFFRRRPSFSVLHLAATAFVTGASVMAVELTSSRVLAPYFGTSIMVWTSLIVANLVGLSFGYWTGGRLAAAQHDPRKVLGRCIATGAILLIFVTWFADSFSTAVAALFFGFTLSTLVLFAGSLVVSFLMFAAPVFFLAIAGPVIVKEWTKSSGGDVGAVAGRYFAVSTLGSVVGTVLPVLVLVPTVGTRATIMIVSVALMGVSIPFLGARARWVLVALLVYTLGLLANQSAVLRTDERYRTESPYQLIRVMDSGDGSSYVYGDAAIMSAYADDGGRTGLYYDYLGVLPYMLGYQDDDDFAVVGFAAGSIARQFRSTSASAASAHIVGVEIDPKMVDVGRELFGADELGVETVVADGRVWLRDTDRRFDAIAFDAFSAVSTPPHLASREFFTLVRSRLKEGGIIGINILSPSVSAPLVRTVSNTLASVFGHVLIVPVAGSAWNHIVLASDALLDPAAIADRLPEGYEDIGAMVRHSAIAAEFDPDVEVLTDDRAPTELMTDVMAVAEAFK